MFVAVAGTPGHVHTQHTHTKRSARVAAHRQVQTGADSLGVAMCVLLLCRPQAEQPFSESTLAYIAALDADRDIATLAAHGITLRPECERVFRACTLTLQKGAAAGLTPSQIAGILCREGLTKSVIEKLHGNATQLAKAGAADARGGRVPQAAYLQKLGSLLDEYLEDYLLECADLLY